MTEVYVTKYALTQGVFTVECRITPYGDAVSEDGRFFPKSAFRLTKDEAIRKAEDMRKRKISFMRSKIETLKDIDFNKQNPFEK